MMVSRRTLLTLVGTALGLTGALLARRLAVPNPSVEQLTPQVWMVVAVPLGTLIGWLAAGWRRWPQAGWIGIIYFFSLFGAARIERLLIGKDAATSTGHTLYFALVIGLQVVGGIVFAVAEQRTSSKSEVKN